MRYALLILALVFGCSSSKTAVAPNTGNLPQGGEPDTLGLQEPPSNIAEEFLLGTVGFYLVEKRWPVDKSEMFSMFHDQGYEPNYLAAFEEIAFRVEQDGSLAANLRDETARIAINVGVPHYVDDKLDVDITAKVNLAQPEHGSDDSLSGLRLWEDPL